MALSKPLLAILFNSIDAFLFAAPDIYIRYDDVLLPRLLRLRYPMYDG